MCGFWSRWLLGVGSGAGEICGWWENTDNRASIDEEGEVICVVVYV